MSVCLSLALLQRRISEHLNFFDMTCRVWLIKLINLNMFVVLLLPFWTKTPTSPQCDDNIQNTRLTLVSLWHEKYLCLKIQKQPKYTELLIGPLPHLVEKSRHTTTVWVTGEKRSCTASECWFRIQMSTLWMKLQTLRNSRRTRQLSVGLSIPRNWMVGLGLITGVIDQNDNNHWNQKQDWRVRRKKQHA